MSDLQLLFLVLVLFYGWECSCWIRRGSVGVVTWLGRRWRVVHPGSLVGNAYGSFILAPPIPPLGTLLTGSQLSVSLSPDGVLAYIPYNINPGWPAPQTGRFVRFDQITSVEARGKKVLVNREVLVKTQSPTHARRLADCVQALAKAPAAERETGIEKIFRDTFDGAAIKNRWDEFQKWTARLRWPANALFILLFLAAPLAIWHFGLKLAWLPLVVVLVGLTTTLAVLFRRAHKVLYPKAEDERFTHSLTILLSPVTSIRARDVLSRPLFEAFHPVAVAQAFCSPADFQNLARRALTDIRFPALPTSPSRDPAHVAAVQFSRAVLRNTLESFLKKNQVDPNRLVSAPAPMDDTCRAYCPRCGAQFTRTEGACVDCGGLQLVAFNNR